jgi:hypothetical protein
MSRVAAIAGSVALVLAVGTLLLVTTGWAWDLTILITGSGAVLATVVLIVSLVIRSQLRSQPIGVRIQAGFLLMALLPAIGVSTGAVVSGYVDGQRRAINRLESVAELED